MFFIFSQNHHYNIPNSIPKDLMEAFLAFIKQQAATPLPTTTARAAATTMPAAATTAQAAATATAAAATATTAVAATT